MDSNIITEIFTTKLTLIAFLCGFIFAIILCKITNQLKLSSTKRKIIQDYRETYIAYSSDYAYRILNIMREYLANCPKENLCQNDLDLYLRLNKSIERITERTEILLVQRTTLTELKCIAHMLSREDNIYSFSSSLGKAITKFQEKILTLSYRLLEEFEARIKKTKKYDTLINIIKEFHNENSEKTSGGWVVYPFMLESAFKEIEEEILAMKKNSN